jgi:hypothetical protein
VINLTTPPTCVQLFNEQAICEFEGGTWLPTYTSCCAVENDPNSPYFNNMQILPDKQAATRNDFYKLVQITAPDCSSTPYQDVTTNEFYKINEDVPVPLIDKAEDNLCAPPGCPNGLSGEDLANYKRLLASQQATLSSEPACPGDGNEDKLVNQADLANWSVYSQIIESTGFTSSWYDFNYDGYTNAVDQNTILANFGTNCMSKKK